MITFILSIVLLVIAYFTYGKYVEKTFGVHNERQTPAYRLKDGVDYIPMEKNRNGLIQLLNIAGVGPIFGPIMGALYGPVAFLWIVLGSIFAGAVHDYLTGMISLRNKGAHLPELAGKFLGKTMKHIVNVFAMLLLILVGTVFVTSPASLIANLTPDWVTMSAIIAVIFAYYILATLLPIDQIIGRIYPYFGALLLISAFGIGAMLLIKGVDIPELSLENMHPAGISIFPALFFTISCGALSGFHATQSPIISRTTEKEKEGRFIFYGMMIAEAVIAMIWAAASMSLFDGQTLNEMLANGGPAAVVNDVSVMMLGGIGGTLAVLGVIVLPITSGDTAFRSLRMIIADYFNIEQQSFMKRLYIAIPLFIISYVLTKVDFNILWRYFNWANQSTAVIALFVGAMYLYLKGRNYFIALIPGIFVLYCVSVYILNEKIGFNLPMNISCIIGAIITLVLTIMFMAFAKKQKALNIRLDDDVDTAA
jgi:carbon starvation protein CstA